MKIAGKWISGITVVSLAVLLSMTFGLPVVRGQAAHVSWEIVRLAGASPGIASAFANDGSHITLTGSGTFVAPAGGDGTSSATTGGGTWKVFASGATTASATGTYDVTGLVRWDEKR